MIILAIFGIMFCTLLAVIVISSLIKFVLFKKRNSYKLICMFHLQQKIFYNEFKPKEFFVLDEPENCHMCKKYGS